MRSPAEVQYIKPRIAKEKHKSHHVTVGGYVLGPNLALPMGVLVCLEQLGFAVVDADLQSLGACGTGCMKIEIEGGEVGT